MGTAARGGSGRPRRAGAVPPWARSCRRLASRAFPAVPTASTRLALTQGAPALGRPCPAPRPTDAPPPRPNLTAAPPSLPFQGNADKAETYAGPRDAASLSAYLLTGELPVDAKGAAREKVPITGSKYVTQLTDDNFDATLFPKTAFGAKGKREVWMLGYFGSNCVHSQRTQKAFKYAAYIAAKEGIKIRFGSVDRSRIRSIKQNEYVNEMAPGSGTPFFQIVYPGLVKDNAENNTMVANAVMYQKCSRDTDALVQFARQFSRDFVPRVQTKQELLDLAGERSIAHEVDLTFVMHATGANKAKAIDAWKELGDNMGRSVSQHYINPQLGRWPEKGASWDDYLLHNRAGGAGVQFAYSDSAEVGAHLAKACHNSQISADGNVAVTAVSSDGYCEAAALGSFVDGELDMEPLLNFVGTTNHNTFMYLSPFNQKELLERFKSPAAEHFDYDWMVLLGLDDHPSAELRARVRNLGHHNPKVAWLYVVGEHRHKFYALEKPWDGAEFAVNVLPWGNDPQGGQSGPYKLKTLAEKTYSKLAPDMPNQPMEVAVQTLLDDLDSQMVSTRMAPPLDLRETQLPQMRALKDQMEADGVLFFNDGTGRASATQPANYNVQAWEEE